MEVEFVNSDAPTPENTIVRNRLPLTVGQSPDSDIRLDSHWVSRYHCEITSVKGTLVVRDLGSMLGTFVNGISVTTAVLRPGDKLTVGDTSFLVNYTSRRAKVSAPVSV